MNFPFSVGLHPWYVNEMNLKNLKFESFKDKRNFFAVGECGLDRHRKHNFTLQKEAFVVQLKFASENNLPLIVHCVRAYSDLLMILKSEKFKGILICHDFRGNIHEYNKLSAYNCWFSFGKSLFNASDKLLDVFRNIPLTSIFLETDDSEIPIEKIYLRAAELRSLEPDLLKQRLEMNFYAVFGYGKLVR